LDEKLFKIIKEEEELKRRPISKMNINNYNGRFNQDRSAKKSNINLQ
jgi:hypothetical protein